MVLTTPPQIITVRSLIHTHRYLALNAGLVYLYFALYQRVDADEYGGTWELIKEGFMTSYALFLVSYTSLCVLMGTQY